MYAHTHIYIDMSTVKQIHLQTEYQHVSNMYCRSIADRQTKNHGWYESKLISNLCMPVGPMPLFTVRPRAQTCRNLPQIGELSSSEEIFGFRG